jgi:hypothetical protein
MEIERRRLGRFDHVADRDARRVTGQCVAAASPARAAHDPGATEPQQDLLHVIAGQTLELGNLAAGDRPFSRAPSEVERTDDAVFGKRSDAHESGI